MAELEACVEACMGDNMPFSSRICANPHTRPENPWVTFEAAVRSAAATALGRWRSGVWRFDDVVRSTHDASAFDSDDDDGAADRVQGSTSSITQNDQYDIDWGDIGGAQRPAMAMEAARLLHTARQMVDTSRWWLMRWPRNATALLVRAGGLKDDEASKLFRALRVTAIRFGLELAALPKAPRRQRPKKRRTRALHYGNGGWQRSKSWGQGTGRNEEPRCRTGLRSLTCPRTRCDGLSTAGPSRCLVR